MAGFNADGSFNFDNNNSSLAGFGYQDPLYDSYDGMSKPGTYSTYGSSLGNVSASDPIDAIMKAADKNNAWSASQAEKQNQFQIEQNEKAMQFNSAEAAKNRAWQEEMSNTAHQREVIDLQKAGLNPVLSATGGNGASVGSGATASGVTSAGAKGDTDESSTMAIMSYMAQLLSAQTSILNTQTSANATLANAELMSAASRYGSDMNYAIGVLDYDKSLNDFDNYMVHELRGDSAFVGNPNSFGPTSAKVVENVVNDPRLEEKTGADRQQAVQALHEAGFDTKNKDGKIAVVSGDNEWSNKTFGQKVLSFVGLLAKKVGETYREAYGK